MSRIAQSVGTKGSLKWIQKAVATKSASIQPEALPTISWLSPLESDDFAEYRDSSFLELIGLPQLTEKLHEFWPIRGPQWDALGRFSGGCVLVEAKAHLSEFVTPPCQAGAVSRALIDKSLLKLSNALGVDQRKNWAEQYYQYANRLAHLWWLREQGVNAHLILVGFVGDSEMNGPHNAEDWTVAYSEADEYLGIPSHTVLGKFVHHLSPQIREL